MLASSATAADWDEVGALLSSNVVPAPTPLPPGLLLPSPPDTRARDSAVAFRAAAERVLLPLLSNALERGPAGDARVLAVRATQPWLAFALDHVAGAAELLKGAGFAFDASDGRYVLPPLHDPDAMDGAARAAALARLEQARATLRRALNGGGAQTPVGSSPSTIAPPKSLVVPEVKSRVNRAAEDAQKAALKEAIRRDREQLEAARQREAQAEAQATAGLSADREAAAALLEAAKRTIHFTGRLRNLSFEGEGFTIRTMRHGRAYACGDSACMAEIGGLEVHWHLFSGPNNLYAYVAHLSPDASEVLHIGPEIGYQYNTMPHTEHFQKTLMTRRVRMNREGGLVDFTNANTVAHACEYCNVPFHKLWK
mmetsp:Transcript_25829/g.79710  ORF Transcript_25829/g.79710 Transcript_25829/m.79710 type:complete len:369 (-) Transcript_25829:61-1167(-)